jgi:hypothetical protein
VAARFDEEGLEEARIVGRIVEDEEEARRLASIVGEESLEEAWMMGRITEDEEEARRLAAIFDEERLQEARIVGRIFEFDLVDWNRYAYAGRRLGIVETPQGPQAWYIRTGKGGKALAGDPAAGEPARIYGFAHLQELDAAGEPVPGSSQKWFIKPPAGGRMGEGNEEVYHWLRLLEEFGTLKRQWRWATEVPRTEDVSDIARSMRGSEAGASRQARGTASAKDSRSWSQRSTPPCPRRVIS